jgi:hypothetical protein
MVTGYYLPPRSCSEPFGLVEATVPRRLGEVLGAALLPPVENPGAKAHAPHGHLEGALAGLDALRELFGRHGRPVILDRQR